MADVSQEATTVDDARVPEIAKGMTKAQREALAKGKWNTSELFVDYLPLGIVQRDPPVFVCLTPLDLAVRAHLLSETTS